MQYLNEFLLDNPHGTECPEAGHPSYGEGVEILYDESAVAVNGSYNYTQSRVGANYWMGYHTILKWVLGKNMVLYVIFSGSEIDSVISTPIKRGL